MRARATEDLRAMGKQSSALPLNEKRGRYRYQLARPIQTLVSSVSSALAQVGVTLRA